MYQSSFIIKSKELRKERKRIKRIKTIKVFTLNIKDKYLTPKKKKMYQSSFKIIKKQNCLL